MNEETPVQLAEGQWYIPGRKEIIGFGDVKMTSKEVEVDKVISSIEGELGMKPHSPALAWLFSSTDRVCGAAR